MSLAADARREVQVRHDFFAAWFTGRADEAAMAEAAQAFAPDFGRIGPDGAIFDREATLAMLRGARREAGFAIRTDLGQTVEIAGGLVRVTYDETQHLGGTSSVRRATALFSADARAPCGALWRFVQETWIS